MTAAEPREGLLELPRKCDRVYVAEFDGMADVSVLRRAMDDYYTADQMRAYALQVIAQARPDAVGVAYAWHVYDGTHRITFDRAEADHARSEGEMVVAVSIASEQPAKVERDDEIGTNGKPTGYWIRRKDLQPSDPADADARHSTQDDYDHFLAYSGLDDNCWLRYAYFHGADVGLERPELPTKVLRFDKREYDHSIELYDDGYYVSYDSYLTTLYTTPANAQRQEGDAFTREYLLKGQLALVRQQFDHALEVNARQERAIEELRTTNPPAPSVDAAAVLALIRRYEEAVVASDPAKGLEQIAIDAMPFLYALAQGAKQ